MKDDERKLRSCRDKKDRIDEVSSQWVDSRSLKSEKGMCTWCVDMRGPSQVSGFAYY